MSTNKGATLSLLLAIAVIWGDEAAYAKQPRPSDTGTVSVVQNHNNKQKSEHSARKQAAKRLRTLHQQEHQQQLQDWASKHHGYTGLGEAGDGSVSVQQPAHKGGVK